jgi:hypothetical protein
VGDTADDAAHKDREFIFNNQIQKLKPGQLITGRKNCPNSPASGNQQSRIF